MSGQAGCAFRKGLLLSRVSHPNPIYDLGATANGTSSPGLNKTKSRRMITGCGEEFRQNQKFCRKLLDL